MVAKKKIIGTKTDKKGKSKKAVQGLTQNIIEGCNFVGVKWDEAAIDAVDTVALGLVENAKAIRENALALNKLACVLLASNVHIETMIRVDPGKGEA